MVKKKRDRTQEHLDQLREIRGRASEPEGVAVLRAALASPSNYVVAKAAEIAEQARVPELAPSLLEAWDRFIADAPHLDRGCSATTAIIKALYALDYQESGPYRRGIRHRQMEGLGPVDVATELRGACALGLAMTRDEYVIDELVRLLADNEAPARLSAARAIGCRNEPASVPVLMLKVHEGDAELEVLAECLAGILAVDGTSARALGFVLEQLDDPDPDRAEAAAIALGSVRDDRAFEALRDKWEGSASGPLRERLLHAMSMSRTERAIEYLVGLAAREPVRTAALAVRYLAIHRRDERIASLAESVAAQRPELASVIRAAFNRSTLE